MADGDGTVEREESVDASSGRSARRWPRRVVLVGGVLFALWVGGIGLIIDLALALGEEETGPGDWAAPVWFCILALLAVAAFGTMLIDRTGRLAAGSYVGIALVAWVGPALIGGSAAPWDASNPPLTVIVPAIFFAVAAIWAGQSTEPAGPLPRRWPAWLGVALGVPALGLAGFLAIGLIEPDEYRLTVRTF